MLSTILMQQQVLEEAEQREKEHTVVAEQREKEHAAVHHRCGGGPKTGRIVRLSSSG
jgi:hypothetical protein